MIDLEVSNFWHCWGGCTHCGAAALQSKPTRDRWEITLGVRSAIHRLLTLAEMKDSTCSLNAASALHEFNMDSLDLWIHNERVENLWFLVDSKQWQETVDSLVHQISESIRSRFTKCRVVDISISRERKNLDNQYELQIQIFTAVLKAMISEKFATVNEVVIIGGCNDTAIDDMKDVLEKCKSVYDIIFPVSDDHTKKWWTLSDASEWALREAHEMLAQFLWSNGIHVIRGNDTVNYDGQSSFSWGIKFSGREISLFNTFFNNQEKWKRSNISSLIACLRQTTTGWARVHFSWNKVNIFHRSDVTNLPWVWITLAEYQNLLTRAEKIGYKQALIEHFFNSLELQTKTWEHIPLLRVYARQFLVFLKHLHRW